MKRTIASVFAIGALLTVSGCDEGTEVDETATMETQVEDETAAGAAMIEPAPETGEENAPLEGTGNPIGPLSEERAEE